MTERRYRQLDDCIRDAVWVRHGDGCAPHRRDLREQAAGEVLCRLPREPYERLKRAAGTFRWFVPPARTLGRLARLPATSSLPIDNGNCPAYSCRIVYLSPLLEQYDESVAVLVTAHELAHVILDHDLLDLDEVTRHVQERQVATAIRDWGFRRDAEHAERLLLQAAILDLGRLLKKSE